MSRVLTAKDAYALMNLLVKEATGQDATIQVVDSSTFVSAGEKVLATGTENTLNSLALVLGRTFMAVRPYKAKMAIINSLNTGAYTNRLRKISFYSREAQAAGDWNTDLNTNLGMGLSDGSGVGSEWVQNQPVPLEMNFAGSSVWDDCTTIYEYQLKVAFRSEGEFAQFVSGILTEKGNDIESQKEAFNRMNLLNYMAGLYDLHSADASGCVINLRTAYNTKFGTNYSVADLLGAHFTEFLEFFIATFKTVSDYMTNRTAKYHWSPAKTIGSTSYTLMRHTPKDKQKAVLYNPLLIDAQARVFPEIFNEQYLRLSNFEGVDYWQNVNNPSAIKVTPAIPDVTGAGGQTAGSNVDLAYVVGLLFDEDAIMTDFQLENAYSTPLNARHAYRNLWYHFSKNAINDFTENAVLFILAD